MVLGGSVTRMESFACHVARELGVTGTDGEPPVNLSKATDRYVLFKAGPVLIANVSENLKVFASLYLATTFYQIRATK